MGGVRDNLGLSLLEAMDRLARDPHGDPGGSSWSGFQPDHDWQLDVMLVSDGGKFLQAKAPSGAMASAMRAIDLSGLATGVLRPMLKSPEHPRVLLSALSQTALSPDAIILGQPWTALRDAQYSYFRPDTLDDDVVNMILALQANPMDLKHAWQRHRAAGRRAVNPEQLSIECEVGRRSIDDADCAWWSVVVAVGKDIWQSTMAFAAMPTLNDVYTEEQARIMFRFGQYLALLRATELREAMSQALQNRRDTQPSG